MSKVDLRQGNVLDVLKQMAANSVHTVITSPPYYGLRAYGTQPQIWLNGKEPCTEHQWGDIERGRRVYRETNVHAESSIISDRAIHGQNSRINNGRGDTCVVCGAWRGELGAEPDPAMYIEHLVQIFREVRRVLRDDGVLWLNLGDSYAGSWGNYMPGGLKGEQRPQSEKGKRWERRAYGDTTVCPPTVNPPGFKQKDLMGIPWRTAIALQADGWYLRSAPPWVKGNCMPESVDGWRWERHRIKVEKSKRGNETWRVGSAINGVPQMDHGGNAVWDDCPGCDKCSENDGYILRKGSGRMTTAHEMWFVLAKSDEYFWDANAVRGNLAESSIKRDKTPRGRRQNGGKSFESMTGIDYTTELGDMKCNPTGRNWRTSDVFNDSLDEMIEFYGEYVRHLINIRANGGMLLDPDGNPLALKFNTIPFRAAHFATFSPKMILPIILASTSEKGVCPKCGAPWVRVIEKQTRFEGGSGRAGMTAEDANAVGKWAGTQHGKNIKLGPVLTTKTDGWKPSCECGSLEPVPAVVLDPFAGAGTVGVVCKQTGRDFWGVDVKDEYVEMARARIEKTPEPPKRLL